MSYAKQIFTKTLNVDQFNKGPILINEIKMLKKDFYNK